MCNICFTGLHRWVHCHGAAMQPFSSMHCTVSPWEAIMWRHDLDAGRKKKNSKAAWLSARADFWLHGYHWSSTWTLQRFCKKEPISNSCAEDYTHSMSKLEIKAVFDFIVDLWDSGWVIIPNSLSWSPEYICGWSESCQVSKLHFSLASSPSPPSLTGP